MASVKRLFHAELARLESDPPTELEIAEARNHFLGRRQSAAQSNTEIAHRLMRDWLARGEIVSMESLRTRLDAVGREDVIRILPAFCAGSVITVNVEGISSWPAK
jgi:predicted Zn-dependent peptidase